MTLIIAFLLVIVSSYLDSIAKTLTQIHDRMVSPKKEDAESDIPVTFAESETPKEKFKRATNVSELLHK